jgi:hypothetical protein
MKYYTKLFFLTIAILIIGSYISGFTIKEYPFYSIGFDSYSHIGNIRTFENMLGSKPENLDKNMFPYLYEKDIHLGPYFFLVYLLSDMLHIDVKYNFLIFGIVNLTVLIIGLYLLARSFNLNKKVSTMSIFLFFLIVPLLTSSFTGRELFDRYMITAHFPAFFGISMLIYLIYLNNKYIDHKEDKVGTLIIVQSIIFLSLFLSHLFTGLIYLGYFAIFSVTSITLNKHNTKKVILLCLGFLMMILISTSWSFYKWFNFLSKQKMLYANDIILEVFNIQTFFLIVGISVIGILFFLKSAPNKLPLSLWGLCIIFISFSYVFSIAMPVYYRFINFLKIPLIIGLAWVLLNNETIKKSRQKVVITLIIIIYLIVNVNTFTDLEAKKLVPEDLVIISKYINESSNILAEGLPSSYLQITPYTNLFIMAENHISDLSSVDINYQRMSIMENLTIMNKEEIFSFLSGYKINYLVLSKDSPILKNVNEKLNLRDQIIYYGENYVLITIPLDFK